MQIFFSKARSFEELEVEATISVLVGRSCRGAWLLHRKRTSPFVPPSLFENWGRADSGGIRSLAFWNAPPTASRLPLKRCHKRAGRVPLSRGCDRGRASRGRI